MLRVRSVRTLKYLKSMIRTGLKWLRIELNDHHLLRRWLYCKCAFVAIVRELLVVIPWRHARSFMVHP